jgi:phosphoglycolate phosphatase-like HAD superfamily hydrolase
VNPTILLFDVDGTLVTTGGAGRGAILRAMELCGVTPLSSFSFAGMTDRAIVRRFLDDSGLGASEARIDQILERYLTVLAEEVARVPAHQYRLHAGVLAALDRVGGLPAVAVGLGTGNVERGARIKLERVGVSERFAFGGFGDDHEDRVALLAVGAERGAARLGVDPAGCRVVVIGDTPRDVAAAKAIGAESVAVATGTIDYPTLQACRPTHLFPDLTAPGAVAALLGSGPA